jgi:NADH-quinone oxidoreductase subunit F
MNIEELRKTRDEIGKRRERYDAILMVCTGTTCQARGSLALVDRLENELIKRDLTDRFLVVPTGCLGLCSEGPTILVQPEGILYTRVSEDDLADIVEQHLLQSSYVDRLLYRLEGKAVAKIEDVPFYAGQQLVALRHRSTLNPEKIDDYIGASGYQTGYEVVTGMEPTEVVDTVVRSGLRGRGGGGYPTGLKWRACREAVEKTGNPPVVVCNADEGDPGFMDEAILAADPHSVIEGMMIAAFAVGAKEGYVFVRREHPLALRRMSKAIEQARRKKLLGVAIFGTDFSFDINVHIGAGAYVSGESSALMQALAGHPGEPRSKYVHTTERGFRDMPTVLNNVETIALLPAILEKGPVWFSSIGTGDVSKDPWAGNTGTKVISLSGAVRNAGLLEVPMGTTLREIIFGLGGGVPEGSEFKALQIGGPTGGFLPESQLDLPLEFDSLSEAESPLGSGSLIVLDDSTCMVQLTRFMIELLKEESCGKCTPCREGLVAIDSILRKIASGEGKKADLDLMMEYGQTMTEASLCDLGKSAATPIASALRYFREEFETHIKDGKCPAGKCRELITYSIVADNCTGCTVCVEACPEKVITGEPGKPHVIDQDGCTRCGMCREVCRFDAVEVR